MSCRMRYNDKVMGLMTSLFHELQMQKALMVHMCMLSCYHLRHRGIPHVYLPLTPA